MNRCESMCKSAVYGLNGLRPLRGRVEIWRDSSRASFLFWSAAARSSKWVGKKWRHRLTYRGLGSITPNGLEHQSCASLQMSWRLSNSAHPSCMSLSRAVRCRKRAERRAKRSDREGDGDKLRIRVRELGFENLQSVNSCQSGATCSRIITMPSPWAPRSQAV